MTTINISDKFKIEIDNYNHTLMEFNPGGGDVPLQEG